MARRGSALTTRWQGSAPKIGAWWGMARGGAGSVGWRASLRSGVQGGVDPGGPTMSKRRCGFGGHGGRGDKGGQPLGHLAGRNGGDAVGASRALGSRPDLRKRCGSGVREQWLADQQQRWGRVWSRCRRPRQQPRRRLGRGGEQRGSASQRLAAIGHDQASGPDPISPTARPSAGIGWPAAVTAHTEADNRDKVTCTELKAREKN
jgi:hypothetical protein